MFQEQLDSCAASGAWDWPANKSRRLRKEELPGELQSTRGEGCCTADSTAGGMHPVPGTLGSQMPNHRPSTSPCWQKPWWRGLGDETGTRIGVFRCCRLQRMRLHHEEQGRCQNCLHLPQPSVSTDKGKSILQKG